MGLHDECHAHAIDIDLCNSASSSMVNSTEFTGKSGTIVVI